MIPIFRGDDTNFNDALFLTIKISATFDLSGFTAELVLGGGAVVKNAVLGENGAFEVVISAEESKLLPFGEVKGSVILVDKENRRRTIATDILFNVTNEVTEGLEYTADLSVTETEATVLNIKVGGGAGGGTTDYNELENKPSIAGVTLMKDVSLADIGAASSGDIAQSTQAILTAESENTTAILENAEENKSAILTNASENTSDIKANTDAKASEIIAAVDESETAITSAVSAAQADIKADIAELKESGGGSASLDAAFMEVISGLDKQKQILAQALNDKGVNVTSTDTLDKMAAEIKDLDVVGAQDKVVCEFYNQLNATSNGLSERISSAQARVLRERNAIISRTSAGVFGIYKLAVDGTLTEIASCDCSDFVPAPSASDFQCRFGVSKNEEYIAWYDSPKKNLILFHMDWETNTLTRTLAYTVTTSKAGTYGSYYETNTSSQNCLIGIAPASDGSKVCILSNNNNAYIHATIVDVATQTEVTNIGTTANAVNNTDKICWGFWHWDIETGIIKGGTSHYPLFEMTLDLSGEKPFMSFGGYRITRMGNYPANCYGMPYFFWDKGLMLQLGVSGAATGYVNTPSGVYGTLWLRDIETGKVLDSAEIEIDRTLRTDKSNTSYNRSVGISNARSYLHSPVVVKKDGKIIVGFGMYMRFELDEENKKLIPYKHNGAKDANGRYVCFNIYSSSSTSTSDSYVNGDYIYCEENPDLIFSRTGSREAYGGNWSTSEDCFVFCREEPSVLGLFLNRNGKRRLMYDSFSYTQYKAGAYAEKDEVAVVNVESGEAE